MHMQHVHISFFHMWLVTQKVCSVLQGVSGWCWQGTCNSTDWCCVVLLACAAPSLLRPCAVQAAAVHGVQQGLPPDKRVSDMGQDMNGHDGSMQQAQQYDSTTQHIIVSVY